MPKPEPEESPARAAHIGNFERAAPPGPPRPVDRVLRQLEPGATWGEARRAIESGKVRVNGVVVTDPTTLVVAGSSVEVRLSAPRPRGGPTEGVRLVYADAHVVVVNKPAGLATVPFGDERDTLDRVAKSLLRKTARPGTSIAPLGVVQRLDKETSGLVVFARTVPAKRALQQQFRDHAVHRRYVAIAHGAVPAATLRSRLVTDRGDGLRGSTKNPNLGREAITNVRPMEPLSGATLVECALETGRTHQIRIHLSEAGHPLVGERVYVRDYAAPLIAAERLMLHAAELGFFHPVLGRDLDFSEPFPGDMEKTFARLRANARERRG